MANTRLLHVSDTHLGRRQYKSDIRRDDFAAAFDAAIDIAIDEDIDAVVHTGDLFDSPRPNTRAISQAVNTLRRLNDAGIPFLGIVGNHERKLQEQWLTIFAEFDQVHRLSQDEPFVVNNSVAVYGIDAVRNQHWETMDFNLADPPEDGMPMLLCMHELFEGLVPPQQADRSFDDVFERLNHTPDAIALGDYHAPAEDTHDGVPVFYAGATERTSATDNDPTVRIITVEDGNLTTSVKPIDSEQDDGTPIPRPFRTVEIDLTSQTTRSDITSRIREVPDEVRKQGVIVVNLTGADDAPVTANDVYDVLTQLDVPVPHVNDKRTPETLDIDIEDGVDPTGMDVESLIEDELDDDLSESVQTIEEHVRDMTIPKSELRDHVDRIVTGGDSQ